MFVALRSQFARRASSRTRNRARLGVERLETRYCPTSLGFTSFTAVPMNTGKWVDLQGVISDSNPTTVVVTFTGVAFGSVNPNSNGLFDFETIATGLGTVTATATDQGGLSTSATATVSTTTPSLTMSLAYGASKQVTLSGKVTDAQAGGLTVTFSGVVSGTARTNADGTYSVTLTASALGTISATTQNVWGLNSNTATATVSNTAPMITLLGSQIGNTWTFSGRVTDNYAPGLTVTFTGPADINNKTTTVQSDGTYSLTMQLASTDTGRIYASVTDWWSDSATAWYLLPG